MARKALLVGVNTYPDPANALRGCVNDVRQVRETLNRHLGFSDPALLRVLTDRAATTSAIKEGLGWLVGGAGAGDVLVFHYSGHGSQVRDRDGDETSDGLDEIICPYDLDWRTPFTDDDLHAVVRDVPRGANLTVILDCCHSGTGLRDLVPPDRRSGAAPVRCIRPPDAVMPRTPRDASSRALAPRRIRRFGERAARAGAVLIAACRDDQVAADAYIDGAYHGALSYYLVAALAAAQYSTPYVELIARVRERLRRHGYDQVPQLEGPAAAKRAEAFAAIGLAAQPC